MGDRTYVSLTVLNEHAEQAEAIISNAYDDPSEVNGDERFTVMGFEEVNYGTLKGLAELRKAGIAYDSAWGDGGDYTAGTESCRFTPTGEADVREIANDEINPDLDQLMALLDDPVKLVEHIKAHHAAVTPLGWEHQAEYGQLYVNKQGA